MVYSRYVRCGKPNCRCARGQLHGPYRYSSQRVNKKGNVSVRTVYEGKK